MLVIAAKHTSLVEAKNRLREASDLLVLTTVVLTTDLVQALKKLVRNDLDLFVAPLGGPVSTGDQAHPVDPSEVSVHEAVAGLGFIVCAIGEAEVPDGVVIPCVIFEVGVLGVGVRLDVSPCAVQNVLAGID